MQRVGVELTQSVDLEQTDRADLVLIESYLILVVMSFVVRKDLGVPSRALPELVHYVRIALAV